MSSELLCGFMFRSMGDGRRQRSDRKDSSYAVGTRRITKNGLRPWKSHHFWSTSPYPKNITRLCISTCSGVISKDILARICMCGRYYHMRAAQSPIGFYEYTGCALNRFFIYSSLAISLAIVCHSTLSPFIRPNHVFLVLSLRTLHTSTPWPASTACPISRAFCFANHVA